MPSSPPARAARPGRNLTLAIAALTLALAYGIWYAYSVMLVALLREFGWSRSVLAGAFSLFAVVQGSGNPLLGMLCDRVDPLRIVAVGGLALGATLFLDSFIAAPWQLYLGFGVATALAVAACGWVPAVVIVQRHFQDRLGLALGIVSSGVGVGMLVVVPLHQVLIDAVGWRMTYRVIGALCVLWIVPSALFLLARGGTPPAPLRAAPSAHASATPRATPTFAEAVRGAPFWLIVACFFFGAFGSQTLHVHQVAFLVDHGIGALAAASVVGVVGVASILGKTGGGWLSDRVERERVYCAGIAVLVLAVGALLWVGRHPSTGGAYLYACLLGIGYSATAALTPAMISDRFSGPHFGTIMGMALLGSAAGSAFGPWFAGHLFDLTGSYQLPLRLAALAGVLAGAAAWVARLLRVRGTARA